MEIEKMPSELNRIRRRERLCARTRKGKALLVINHILSNIESEDKLLSKLFRIAHCATGVCGNPHKDWVKELDETYKGLKEEK